VKYQALFDALRNLNETSAVPSLEAIHYMREIKNQTIPEDVAKKLVDIYVKREE
jgi:hypothetical protein